MTPGLPEGLSGFSWTGSRSYETEARGLCVLLLGAVCRREPGVLVPGAGVT